MGGSLSDGMTWMLSRRSFMASVVCTEIEGCYEFVAELRQTLEMDGGIGTWAGWRMDYSITVALNI